MADAVKVMRGLEEMYPHIHLIERLRHSIETYPNINWGDVMSRGQITSKMWIVQQLRIADFTSLGRVAICGGWVGMLARIMLDDAILRIAHIHSMDLDESATNVANNLNREYEAYDQFLATVDDCNKVQYDYRYETVINTSCEHFEDFDGWYNNIAKGRLVILQSNDFTEIEDHVNCVENENELAEKANFRELLYKGALPCYGYTRFMVIGVK